MALPKSIGKYEIRGLLGRGGMGIVYDAWQPDLNREVAIKVIAAGAHLDPDLIRRFKREAELAAKLSHPDIVQVHDVGSADDIHFIVMEKVEGTPLKDHPVEPEEACRIAYRVARTLQFAHGLGVIHRDIKPGNILIDKAGQVRVLDFGLAKSLNESQAISVSGDVLGTPQYMAPEQAFGSPSEVDARTDVYAVGTVLYELLTGRSPFEAETVLATLRKIEEEEPKPPSSINPEVTPAMDAVCARAMAKKKEDRFATADELAGALRDLMRGDPSVLLRFGRKKPFPTKTVIVTVAALVLLAVAAVFLIPRDPGSFQERLHQARSLSAEDRRPVLDKIRRDLPVDRLRLRAETAELLGGYGEAAELYRAAHEKNPADRDSLYRAGVCRLASGESLLYFLAPGIFGLEAEEFEDAEDEFGGERGRSQLLGTLHSLLQHRIDSARDKLKGVRTSAVPEADRLLLEAHVALREALYHPPGERSRILQSMLGRLKKREETGLRTIRMLMLAMAENREEAGQEINRLMAVAPGAPETYVAKCVAYFHGERPTLAVENLRTAARLSNDTLEIHLPEHYVMFFERLTEPEDEAFEESLRDVVGDSDYEDRAPAAFLLSAAYKCLLGRIPEAREDVEQLGERVSPETVHLMNEFQLLVEAGTWDEFGILLFTRDIQARAGLSERARDTCYHLLRTLPEGDDEEIRGIRRDTYVHLAVGFAEEEDEPRLLKYVRLALEHGAPAKFFLEEEVFGELRGNDSFRDLLKEFRK